MTQFLKSNEEHRDILTLFINLALKTVVIVQLMFTDCCVSHLLTEENNIVSLLLQLKSMVLLLGRFILYFMKLVHWCSSEKFFLLRDWNDRNRNVNFTDCTATGQPWTEVMVTIANRTAMCRTKRDRRGKLSLVCCFFVFKALGLIYKRNLRMNRGKLRIRSNLRQFWGEYAKFRKTR